MRSRKSASRWSSRRSKHLKQCARWRLGRKRKLRKSRSRTRRFSTKPSWSKRDLEQTIAWDPAPCLLPRKTRGRKNRTAQTLSRRFQRAAVAPRTTTSGPVIKSSLSRLRRVKSSLRARTAMMTISTLCPRVRANLSSTARRSSQLRNSKSKR